MKSSEALTADDAQRLPPLQGGRNFRDLGGYRTHDGRRVRWGRLYRSGSLAALTEADCRYLGGLGIRWVCDLRTTHERRSAPSAWCGDGAPLHWSRDYTLSFGDLRELHKLQGEIVRYEPHFIFHLAAQSLVRRSYAQPADTFMVNTQGTVHVLEALRSLHEPCIAIMITTDKVYENPERGTPFAEDDKLGGHDPYSASKAAAEIAIASYSRSFFHRRELRPGG